MPRSSRQKSHRQHYKESSLHSVDDGSPKYGPGVVPKSPEVKRNKDEVSSKSGRPDPLKAEREFNVDNGTASSRGKRKSPNSEGLDPSESLTSKRRHGSVSVSAVSLPDRWNGGEVEGDALSLLAYLDCSKEKDSKADSESSGGNPGVVEERALKNEEKGHRKSKETEGIAMSDLVNSTHMKSRVPQRKESIDAYSQGNVQKCPDAPYVNVDSDALSKGTACLAKSGASLNLDRDREAGRTETREFKEGDLQRDVQQTMGWAKNVQDTKQENSDNLLSGTLKNSRGTGNECSHKLHILEESFQKEGQESTEWRIQAEHRNLELEKELENRIRRRREGSGERDRQWDDDRNREGKFCHSRESLPRNDRHKDERQRDDKPRDDRLKVERRRDDTLVDDRCKDDKRRDGKANLDRHKGERQRVENSREDRHGDVRQRDDRRREDKYREDNYRADKYKDKKSREEMFSRECSGDRYDSRISRNETSLREGHYKPSKCYASDQEYSPYHDDQYAEHDNYNDISRASHKGGAYRQKRAHGNKGSPTEHDHVGTRKGCQDDALVQGKMTSGLPNLNAAGAGKNANWKKRDRDTDCDSDRDQKRLKDTSFEESSRHPRGKQNTHNFEQLSDYSNKRSRNRTGWQGDAHGDREELPLGNVNSPLKSNGCLSPAEMVQGSLSPSVSERRHPSSYDRPIKRKKLENDSDVTGASGMQYQRGRSGNYPGTLDRGKAKLRSADEIRYRESRVVLNDSDTRRDRSQSRDRDGFSKAPHVYAADSRISGLQDEAFGLDCHSKQFLSSDCLSPSDEGPKGFGHSEEMNSSRSGWPSHRIQNSRSAGIPGRPRAPSYPVRPSGHLPPPPPVRPNIDNPAILGPSNGGFEEECIKDQGRGDWKASASLKRGELDGVVRNWNSQAQGTGPNNIFIPFQHQMGGHPSGVFSNMGQQYTGLPLRGVRPSADMNHGGVPYHMWDGGDGFLGHNGTFSWHGPANHVRAPNVYGSLHAWNGQASYGGEPLGYGRPGYYQIGQGVNSQWWDRGIGTWKGHSVDTSKEFLTERESGYPGCHSARESWGGTQDSQEKIRRQRSPTESIGIKTSDKGRAKILPRSSGGGSSSDARKSNKNGCDSIRSYLLHLDVSEDLAGSDLYNQYVSLLGMGNSSRTCNADFSTDVIADSHRLEVDAEAEAVLCSLDTRRKYFPTLPDNKAMDLYKRARKLFEESTVDTFPSIPNVTTGLFENSFAVGEGSKEIYTKISQEVPETSLQCDGSRDNALRRKQSETMSDATAMGFSEELLDGVNETNFSGAGRCSGDSLSPGKESISTDNMMTRDRVFNVGKKGADLTRPIDLTCPIDDGRNLVATVDSYTLPVDTCNAGVVAYGEPVPTPESECNSKKLVKKCGGDDESGSGMLDAETTSMCVRIQGGNPVKGDLCGDQVIYQDESLKSTEIGHEEALLFDLVESKELVSAACLVHTLREVSFHVGCQLFYHYIWLRFQSAMFHSFAEKSLQS